MNDPFEEIKANLRACGSIIKPAKDDIEWLFTEVERLRKENAELLSLLETGEIMDGDA